MDFPPLPLYKKLILTSQVTVTPTTVKMAREKSPGLSNARLLLYKELTLSRVVGSFWHPLV